MTLFDNIRKMASEQGMSLLELNDKAGLGKYSIYSWREKNPTIGNLEKVANVLHTPIDSLLDSTTFVKKSEPLEPHSYQIRVPILGRVVCRNNIFADQNIAGYKDLIFDHKPNGSLFLLKFQDNSMQPLIPNKALVTIKRQKIVENEELTAILIEDSATIRQVKYINNEIILLPRNIKFDPIILNKRNPVIIIGKVIHVDYDPE